MNYSVLLWVRLWCFPTLEKQVLNCVILKPLMYGPCPYAQRLNRTHNTFGHLQAMFNSIAQEAYAMILRGRDYWIAAP